MSIGATPRTTTVTGSTTLTATLLAVPAAGINRYIKHIKVVNSGAAATYTLGLKAAASAPAAGDAGLIALAAPIGANTSVDIFFTGDGLLQTVAAALAITGGASVNTQVNYFFIYQETAL